MKKNLTHLTEGGICIAFATLLSIIEVFHLPYGGGITPASMLPVCIYAYRRGMPSGLMCSFVYGILQMLLGITQGVFKGADLYSTIGMVVIDYILAYSVLGFAGMFKGKFRTDSLSLAMGCLVVTTARYILHILSGYIFFKSYAEWFFSQEGFEMGGQILRIFSGEALYWLYTAVYNGLYMIPEIIITVILSFVVGKYAKIVRVK
ncbi:MAG: energy-coupled thiamine transporter ThiT [Clostridia bacterium]|nr:energy-coupled thiamine transporter ThiT [Clostridia bacterium]